MVGNIRWHHVFDAEAEVGGTFDLRAAEQGSETGNTSNTYALLRVALTLTSMVLITGWPVS